MLKIAITGLGNIGNTHAPVCHADPLSDLVGRRSHAQIERGRL